MRLPWIEHFVCMVVLSLCLTVPFNLLHAANHTSTNRVQLISKQIELLKHRINEANDEFLDLQQQHDTQIAHVVLEKTNKKTLDKISLGILVTQTHLDSLNVELNDSQQTIIRLEKNVQEIENQINVFNMLGFKVQQGEWANVMRVKDDLTKAQAMLKLERERLQYLLQLQNITQKILQLEKNNFATVSMQLKSYHLLNIKQREINDELHYQQLQQYWLKQLNVLYQAINHLDPITSKSNFTRLEREIFYTNENANLAYVQALDARYKDQAQQLQLAILNTQSIKVFNEIGDRAQNLSKELINIENILSSHAKLLRTHIHDLSLKTNVDQSTIRYLNQLKTLSLAYTKEKLSLQSLKDTLIQFRMALDHALQRELSLRQPFPHLDIKTLIDLGKEILFIPTLTFHLIKNLDTNLLQSLQPVGFVAWILFILAQCFFLFLFYLLRKLIQIGLERPYPWHGKMNSRWISVQWLNHNFIEIFLILEMFFMMYFFDIAFVNYAFIIDLLFVWLIFKSVLTILHVWLVEASSDTSGYDFRLYTRLKWIIIIGLVVTAMTVFLHQLPLIYDLKTLFDRLFLLFLMVASWLLLRSWQTFSRMILSYMESSHPYLEKSTRLFCFLLPFLIFVNAVIGLLGYVNLVMTISTYEGIFLVVLIAYLLLRGLFSDLMEQLSRLIVRHASHGWLLTEAFLKPLDKIIQIILFLASGALIFLLYGWDKQSPIVERLNTLLNYHFISILNTSITPLGILQLFIVVAIFYWCARWTREFVYRLLLIRTNDMGIRNSIAILSQYVVVIVGIFICLRVLGINLRALTFVATAFAFGVGLGLRDLANNFAAGFLILLERPIRVGDIVNINEVEGEVTHIGSRAVTIKTWDYADYVVPNVEIFNKSFTNWTFKDNIVRCVMTLKINRRDNPHEIQTLIHQVLTHHQSVLKEPPPEVFLKQISEMTMDFEIRFYVNIRLIISRISVMSDIFIHIWDEFEKHGIKPPYPKHEVMVNKELH